MLKCRAILGLTLVALTVAVSACGGSSTSGSVRGLIQEVEAESLLQLGTLALRDDNGETFVFESNGKVFTRFPPSHLREHMVLGLPVTVVFHREGDALIIDNITD